MNKLKRSEIVLLLCLTALLLITPLLSSSLRPTYLYFIFNLLILALALQAGLLSSAFPNYADNPNTPSPDTSAKNHRALEKPHSDDNIPAANPKMESLNKCPSASTIFFIGEADSEEAEEEASGRGGNGQELFAQAETFIGNFYKQLETQKEESWKNVHRKPF